MKIIKSIKSLRFARVLANLKHFHQLWANASLYKKHGIERRFWQPISYSSITKHDETDLPWLDRTDDKTVIKTDPAFASFDESMQQKLLGWCENGFLSLPGFFDKNEIEDLEKSIEPGLTKVQRKKYAADRVLHLHKSNEKIRQVFKDERLLKILSFILGKEILPFQTINFYKSSSQPAHSDAIHLTTEPLGYSLGVWVALEDVKPGSGEFFYYPGSHKLKYIMNKDFNTCKKLMIQTEDLHEKYESKMAQIIEEKNLKAEVFLPKKGDILIWHTNLIHGSLAKNEPTLTRKSLIMHYFAKGVLCYHEMMEMPAIF
jgi:ectoine hydroxylase